MLRDRDRARLDPLEDESTRGVRPGLAAPPGDGPGSVTLLLVSEADRFADLRHYETADAERS